VNRLGTNRTTAGSAEAFEKIDREYVPRPPLITQILTRGRYVIAAAKAAKSGRDQRVVYVSSGGADKNSMFLYMR
jgi:oxidoreductase